ncbi:sulfur carrier protein ThiS [Marinomonas pollencensis]|uniref:Sulfur carrier protein ThiS n=1 Tax=Marinomonas pollencensis TaxID=491954 RepID=A0A3E0DGU2_9GAMM|nr:sulfur carrier protein ThiS [Marinomonas pollencensis]REG81798.1 sulfur carrier protein ThiS [Marinomonas pollencensis]
MNNEITLYVNDHPLSLVGTTLADLLEQLDKPTQGIAVAIDHEVVPKSRWATTLLADNMNVFIFESIAGG